jgi:hypothetical protein
MPLRKVSGGWTFGGATYKSKSAAERAYRAYLAKKHSRKSKK